MHHNLRKEIGLPLKPMVLNIRQLKCQTRKVLFRKKELKNYLIDKNSEK